MSGESPFDRALPRPQSSRRTEEDHEADALLRKIVETDRRAILSLSGLPTSGSVTVFEAGVFPYVTPTDAVVRASAEEPWIAAIELVAGPDPDAIRWLEGTSMVCSLRFDLPALPILVLLRPEADDPSITGEKVVTAPWGQLISGFYYDVARIWQEPPDRPLGNRRPSLFESLHASGLPGLLQTMRERSDAGASAEALESATCLAFALPDGRRVDEGLRDEVTALERMVPCAYLKMDKYDDGRIVSREEGCAVMRWKLFQRGTRRFGPPDERLTSIIGGLTSPLIARAARYASVAAGRW